ncbi:MAG TPA: 3-oxoacyl-ACP reductase FabG [bacterium]|nr:3-oxoacyl-ACP reductase FabG [bacterium]
MDPLLRERHALVTGGGSGIGRAIALRFAEEGAHVFILDLNDEAARETADAVAALGRTSGWARADVSDARQVAAGVEAAEARLGGLDVLVNNAGITRDATIGKLAEADWDLVLDVHLKGTFLCTQAAAPRLRAAGRGAIVNISSISGKIGNFGQANYASAKAGIVALTKVTAREYARYGVRANAIQPGLIDTAMTRVMTPEMIAQRVKDTPLGRIGKPEDIANVALFLASDLAAFVTGTVIEVTGGRFM